MHAVMTASPKGERIAKIIARSGVCSRREAEALIAEGVVKLNGARVTTPATLVEDGMRITVRGKPIPMMEQRRLWLYHKPCGLLTSHRDPKGRPTVFEHLPKDLPRVISVGRLDLNSEGLLLLTNDGALSRHLELPSTGWLRRYRVRMFGTPSDADLARLRAGITVDGVRYGAIEATVDTSGKSNSWLSVSLREGKNREVRRVFEHLGFQVSRLIRVSYGPFQLGKMEQGEVKEVSPGVIKAQLGAEWATQRE